MRLYLVRHGESSRVGSDDERPLSDLGHMPFMGKLKIKLITDHEDKDIVAFKADSMLCLEKIENHQWAIRWMLNPELFKKGLNL